MDTKKLRQKILDLAIRGRLVPQDPNDEPASVLLERIRAEKERLIKEGKIKRSKKSSSDTPQYENEVPFEVPESWEWCAIEDIADSNIGLTYKPTDISKDGIPVYRSNNIQNRSICLDNVVRVDTPILEKQYLHEGDLLICARNGSRNLVGKCAIIPELSEPTTFGAFMAVCRSRYNKWLFLLLNTAYFDNYLDNSNSTAINQVTQKMLLAFKIPFPPVHEQNRIYNEVCKWFSIIDVIESEEKCLRVSIDKAKSKILDLAIHGKLIPQDPNDEPANELLKRINPKFTPCDNAQYPYDVPYNWVWCKLIDLCSFLSRGKSPTYSEERIYPVFAQKCNLFGGGISLEQARFLEPNTLPKWPEEYKLRDGDVLVNSTGTGTVGRTRLFNSVCLGDYPFVVPDSHVSVVRTLDSIDSDYIYSIMSSRYGQEYIEDNLAGSTNQKELYIGVLENMLIPLPPDKEQQRISVKIKELFAVLDEIQKSIK